MRMQYSSILILSSLTGSNVSNRLENLSLEHYATEALSPERILPGYR